MIESLTPRETETLKLMATGARYRDIGKRLGISHRTVERYIHEILSKLECRTQAEAVYRAATDGLI